MDELLDRVLRRYLSAGLTRREAEVFLGAYARYLSGESAGVEWGKIGVPEAGDLASLHEIEEAGYEEKGRRRMEEVAWVVLNGGLGTSMRMTRAKSLLEVKEGLTFLDLIALHVLSIRKEYKADIPLVFMNSFATHEDTVRALSRYPLSVKTKGGEELPLDFLQNRYPRIREDNKDFFKDPCDPAGWAPPGHGDIYESLNISGTLKKLLDAGKEWLFVSNADNLGASPSPSILGFIAERKIPFALEVTQRTFVDVKGGTVVRHGGVLELLEIAQVDSAHAEEFQDIERFPVFNTNNLWINLKCLSARLENGGLTLPLIVNRKVVEGVPVVQLETAMGAAIGSFPGAAAIVVPRKRFAPVKTTSDFLARRSDLYLPGKHSPLEISNLKKNKTGFITVDLDPEFFGGVDDLDQRIPHPVSLVDADCFVVRGDVRLGRSVVVRGPVKIDNVGKPPLVIPDGTVLEGRCCEG